MKKFITANTKNDQLTNWCQELYAISKNIKFCHIKGHDNVMSDAISCLKRYKLYSPHDSKDPKIPIHPEEEDLEVSIFDRDVAWKNLEITDYQYEISNINVDTNMSKQSTQSHFILGGQKYDIDLNDIVYISYK